MKDYRVRISEESFYKAQELGAREKMTTNDFLKAVIEEGMKLYENKKLKIKKQSKV